jgi:hypothetical protein
MSPDPQLSYSVATRLTRDGHTEVCLVRVRSGPHRLLHPRARTVEGSLFWRRFPQRRLDAISAYEATLERVAIALRTDHLGAWVRRSVLDNGAVELQLYVQRFDGEELTTDLVRSERVVASDVDAVERSASVLVELHAAAAAINDELEASLRSEIEQERNRQEREEQTLREGWELGSILDQLDPGP